MVKKYYTCKRTTKSRAKKEWWMKKKEQNIANNTVEDGPINDPSSPNSTFINDDEYKRINDHELDVQNETTNLPKATIDNRICNITVLQKVIDLQYEHSLHCTYGKLEFHKEVAKGLCSEVVFMCRMCNHKFHVPLTDVNLNVSAVWGTMASGGIYSHSEQIFNICNIPFMTKHIFYKIENQLGEKWLQSLHKSMEESAEIEREFAISQGQVDKDNIPYITVYLDGGWSKRNYGHTYNANSGVAVIIGRHTKKVLFMGIRNKYCSICARSDNKNCEKPEHLCYKNWTQSSGAMEADIIVEGFQKSIQMYGIRYKKFIADGDSSVFAKIRSNVSYGLEVEKIECHNHILKNVGKRLYGIKQDIKNVNIHARKLLTGKKIKELTSTIQNIIYANAHGNLIELQKDLNNVINHTFGCHTHCRDHYCNSISAELNILDKVKITGLYVILNATIETLISKGKHLIDPETNNRAELFMSILARFNMGKRLNLIQRGSFSRRAVLAGLQYNMGIEWNSLHENYFPQTSGNVQKKYIAKEKRKALARSHVPRSSLKRHKNKCLKNTDYGPAAQQVGLSKEEVAEACNRLIDSLQVTSAEAEDIEHQTKGQYNNQLYINHKQNRITASMFAKICKRRKNVEPINLIKTILYPCKITAAPITYGKVHEVVAKNRFSILTQKTVDESGLFVDTIHGFLGASPDGIIDENGIIEIKCLYKFSTKGRVAISEVALDKLSCLENRNNKIQLKRKHDYYYQIQGQLHISKKRHCYFIIYINDESDLWYEKIEADEEFWSDCMLDPLVQFYKNYIAPEIVTKNIKNNLPPFKL